ncbi:site-specific DNA-methyltransferase [Albidovulum sediminicola]|uniref:site-specific DNA-methyltransferase (adenine-specific) n=1 Tax=Albidovulum sediminicola TaxID=2984331 RepID=A0ABT2Z125_9RHOB|nr:site-specific DNA-methyltransferase [Defluviimonas sp. WL0075]MCV2864844.1 site-specific DNA-methyltransferase [Defluviimonas sp. WL0075]
MSDVKDDQTAMSLGADTGNLESVEKFQFAPIKGYPMLNWRGKRPFTSTQFYPAQLKEVHGEEVSGWRNKIFWGDNLQVMSHLLKEFRGSVDLIYIDPPFDSKADYKKNIKLQGKSTSNDMSSFEEKQYTDIWANDDYLQFMYERASIARELLSESGTIYLHCDWHKSHHLRCILDEIFGHENCHNVITWQRSHAQGNSGQGAVHFGRVTDTIFIYSNNGRPTWNQQYVAYTEEVLARDYKYVDEETGERYRLMPVDGPGGASKGNPYYEFLGVSGYWRYSKETMQALYEKGEIVVSSTGRSLSRKRFLKDAKGTPVTDLWDDLNRVSPTSSERLDYPTQKPECLLERIIRTSSNPSEIVLDFFMGSGTSQAVAMKLGRRFIGADINLGAVQTTMKRLINVAAELSEKLPEEGENYYTGFEVYNVNHYDIFRNPAQAKDLLLEALEIQPLELSTVFDGEKDGRMVKVMPVNRIATRADLNELISGFDYKAWERRQAEHPNRPVEKLTLVCMGHEPDLAARLKLAAAPYKIDVEVVDILRDKANLEFRRDSEAKVVIKDGELVVDRFYPMNLLQKLSKQKETVEDWRELVESILIDWNYDGAILQPTVVDIPGKTDLVAGRYKVPADAGTIRVKITDLLSESWEGSVTNG